MDKADKALRRRTLKAFTIFLIFVGVFSAVLIWWLFSARVSIVAVRGDSMEPALSNGENVVLRQENVPEIGMIIVLEKPNAWDYMGTGETVLIKRLAATPQTTLSFDGKAFLVDGKVIYSLAEDNYECAAGEVGYEHKLTQKQVFVMGDNASESLDSRRIFCDGNTEEAYVGYRSVIDIGTVERIF